MLFFLIKRFHIQLSLWLFYTRYRGLISSVRRSCKCAGSGPDVMTRQQELQSWRLPTSATQTASDNVFSSGFSSSFFPYTYLLHKLFQPTCDTFSLNFISLFFFFFFAALQTAAD